MTNSSFTRRLLMTGGTATLLGALASCTTAEPTDNSSSAPAAQATKNPATANEALKALWDGNTRFRMGASLHAGQDQTQAHTLAQGQHPWAIVLGCADSREVPEIFFDQPLGSLFTHRVAGNVLNDHMIGSIEYGLEEFASPVIIIAGHQRCGAVTATVKSIEEGTQPPGKIGAIVDSITATAQSTRSKNEGQWINDAVREHARRTAQQLKNASPLVREAAQSGKTQVLAAIYSLDNLTVSFIDPETGKDLTI